MRPVGPKSPDTTPIRFNLMERTKTTRQQELSALITRGSIGRAVRLLAWPSLAMYLLLVPTWPLQMYLLSKFGKEYVAAGTVGMLVAWIAISLGNLIGVGAPTLIAQAAGRGQWEDAREIVVAALQQAIVIGVVGAIGLFIFRDLLFQVLHLERAVVELAEFYVIVVALSLPAFTINHAISAAFHGPGEMMVALRSGMVVAVISMVGSALLIPGVSMSFAGVDLTIIPDLRMKGAAIALGAGRLGGMLYVLFWLRSTPLCPSLAMLWNRFNGVWHKGIIRLGTPSSIETLQQQVSNFVLLGILSRTVNPTAALAAYGVGDSIAVLFFVPAMGYALAVVPLVGQNVGARQLVRARRVGWLAAGHTALIMSVLGVLLFAFSAPIAEHWAPLEIDPVYHRYLLWYLRLGALVGPVVGVFVVLMGAFRGAGDSITPAALAIGTSLLIRLLQWIACIRLGFDAVAAWSIWAVVLVIMSLALIFLYHRGVWVRAARRPLNVYHSTKTLLD